MIPSKFIAYEERRIGRRLTDEELAVIAAAREECATGKRDTVKAMRAALQAFWAGQPSARPTRSASSSPSGTG